jgi:glycosyltransferase involved in cell wall biosynthesis
VKHGIEVTVITSTTHFKDLNSNKRWTYYEADGIKFWILKGAYSHKLSYPRRMMQFISFMLAVTHKLLRLKCDLVLASSTPITVGLPAYIKKLFSNTPYIFEIRDVWPEVPIRMGIIKNKVIIALLYKFEKQIYKKASHLVALSSGMKKSILGRYLNEKTTVIPNICEINRFRNPSIKGYLKLDIDVSDYNKVILYAGAFGKVNGLAYVVNFASKLINYDSNIIFLLLGQGNEKLELIELCAKKDILNKNIYFLDPVPKDLLPYYYSMCTVGSSFVINNEVLWDNSANKFFDTLAASKPVIVNYEGWQAALIRERNIGYVLPTELSESSILDFVRYINDSNLLKQQGANALKVAEEYFSLEKAVNAYLNIFTKTIL